MAGERIAEHDVFNAVQRYSSEQQKLQWEGTFDDYMTMVIEDPSIVRTSHQTVYGALTSRKDFFTTGANALFGAEEVTERFIEIMKAGAQGLEVGKRIVTLVGPPGSGKSTLVNGTKRAIEEFSRTEEGALYAIKGCPMQEEPLHLIPTDMRPMLKDNYGLHIEGDLCPQCEFSYGGKNISGDILKQVPVERVLFSEKQRVGVGSFKPSDPKSQDMTELIGSVDFSKLGEYGTSSDPRAYRFDGELNVANRGMMEFVEMLKADPKFLYALLDLLQDRVIKPPRFANISADEVVLAHTNLAEYNGYVNDAKNEALRDRMIVVPVPYTLKVSAEQKIYEKLIRQGDLHNQKPVHINPHTLAVASLFSVMTRLTESAKYTKLQKLKIYDGQETDGLTQRDLKELKEEGREKQEGMSGISPRYVIDSLSTALIKEGKKCLTPIDALHALRDNLEFHAHTRDMKKDAKDALKDDLTAAKNEFDEIAKKEIQKAFVYSYEESARTLCDNYLNNVEAFCNRDKIVDPITGDEYDPDEDLMRSIEEQIGISANGKKEFRSELLMRMASMFRRGEQFDYQSHPRLREAVEKKLFADMKDMVKLTTSSTVPNEDQQERIMGVQHTLIEAQGYCEHCSGEMIRYVGNLLSRA